MEKIGPVVAEARTGKLAGLAERPDLFGPSQDDYKVFSGVLACAKYRGSYPGDRRSARRRHRDHDLPDRRHQPRQGDHSVHPRERRLHRQALRRRDGTVASVAGSRSDEDGAGRKRAGGRAVHHRRWRACRRSQLDAQTARLRAAHHHPSSRHLRGDCNRLPDIHDAAQTPGGVDRARPAGGPGALPGETRHAFGPPEQAQFRREDAGRAQGPCPGPALGRRLYRRRPFQGHQRHARASCRRRADQGGRRASPGVPVRRGISSAASEATSSPCLRRLRIPDTRRDGYRR